MQQLLMMSLVLVALGARANDEAETRLYGARPSSATNAGGNGSVMSSSQMQLMSNNSEYVNLAGTTVVLNALPERVKVSVSVNNGDYLEERVLEPREETIYNTQGTLVRTIKATILSTERVLIHQTEPNNRGRAGGFYMVRRRGGNKTDIDIGGPFVGRSNPIPPFTRRGTIYVVNATGHQLEFVANYDDPTFCNEDHKGIEHGNGQFETLKIGLCFLIKLYGDVIVGGRRRKTDTFNAGARQNLSDAVFVFRPRGDNPQEFEFVGPYRLIG